MLRIRFEPWLPSRTSVVVPFRIGFRPRLLRTCVRAEEADIHGAGAASGGRRLTFVRRGAAEVGPAGRGRQPQDVQEVRRPVGHQHRALRPGRDPARSALPAAAATQRDPRRAFDVPPRSPEAAPARRRRQAAGLRAVRSRSALAWPAPRAHPRSHQRRAGRPSAGEPADRLSQLRRDVRHALRPEEQAGAELSEVRQRLRAADIEPAVLLGRVRSTLGPDGRASTRRPEGPRAAAVRGAGGRDRGDELVRGRAQVRRERQRDPQVGSRV